MGASDEPSHRGEFAAALDSAGKDMKSAVASPVNGTLVSCAEDGSVGLNSSHASAGAVVSEWYSKTQAACEATHHQLEVQGKKILANGGPDDGPLMGLDGKPKVDSGANGFARIVEGVKMGFDGRISVAAMTDKGLVVSTGMAVSFHCIFLKLQGLTKNVKILFKYV